MLDGRYSFTIMETSVNSKCCLQNFYGFINADRLSVLESVYITITTPLLSGYTICLMATDYNVLDIH